MWPSDLHVLDNGMNTTTILQLQLKKHTDEKQKRQTRRGRVSGGEAVRNSFVSGICSSLLHCSETPNVWLSSEGQRTHAGLFFRRLSPKIPILLMVHSILASQNNESFLWLAAGLQWTKSEETFLSPTHKKHNVRNPGRHVSCRKPQGSWMKGRKDLQTQLYRFFYFCLHKHKDWQ